jgi:hypothetical protein
MRKITLAITPELCTQLGIVDSASDDVVAAAIVSTARKAAKVDALETQITALKQEKATAEASLVTVKAVQNKKEVDAMLEEAITAKKMTVEVKAQFAKDYAANPEGLKTLLTAMGAYTSVVDQLKGKGELPKKFEGKNWDDLRKEGLLIELKTDYLDTYKEVWEKEHGGKYPTA